MSKVKRSDLVDYVTWSEQRPALLPEVFAAKAARRIHVGENLTFLFENRLTLRYQVQEMMRVERIVREADIQHELDTYNELASGDGVLGCTMMVEVPDPVLRDETLRAWLGLQAAVYIALADGERVAATYDARQVGDDRLSAVQYLRFEVGQGVPVALGVDHARVRLEATLSDTERAALTADRAFAEG